MSGKTALAALVPLGSDAPLGVHYTTIYSGSSTDPASPIRSALEKGKTVDIAVETDLLAGDAAWETLEDLTTKVTTDSPSGKLILCSSGLTVLAQRKMLTYNRQQIYYHRKMISICLSSSFLPIQPINVTRHMLRRCPSSVVFTWLFVLHHGELQYLLPTQKISRSGNVGSRCTVSHFASLLLILVS